MKKGHSQWEFRPSTPWLSNAWYQSDDAPVVRADRLWGVGNDAADDAEAITALKEAMDEDAKRPTGWKPQESLFLAKIRVLEETNERLRCKLAKQGQEPRAPGGDDMKVTTTARGFQIINSSESHINSVLEREPKMEREEVIAETVLSEHSELPPYQEPVLNETIELSERIDLLSAFLKEEGSQPVSPTERALLVIQRAAMGVYYEVLLERLRGFGLDV